MARRLFVTGTDTGVGKTYISCALVRYLAAKNLQIGALKPVASGCEFSLDGYRNEDALALQKAMNVQLSYQLVNPIALPLAIAPHIAAALQGQELSVAKLNKACAQSLEIANDICIIEGAGGWLVPLNPHETMADWVKAINAEVILVVGMRLGCINHALLTYRAIKASGLECIAWVANCIDAAMPALSENIASLKTILPMPLLGVVPYGGNPEHYFDGSVIDVG